MLERPGEQVKCNPWGLPYSLVMGKLFKNTGIMEINSPGRVENIVA